MRLVVRGADFSAVSIGKVYKDISFDLDYQEIISILENPPYNPAATPSSTSYGTFNNNARFITDYIPVVEGMTIIFQGLCGGNSVPAITCYDSSKTIKTPPQTYSIWSNDDSVRAEFVVPAGVSFIRATFERLTANTKLERTMPEY